MALYMRRAGVKGVKAGTTAADEYEGRAPHFFDSVDLGANALGGYDGDDAGC